jgi:DNA repair exonuclease SbcCD ATPase subunit
MPKRLKHEHHTADEAREELKDVMGCLSCGLPMTRTQRETASELTDICPGCSDQHGHLKSYEEVFERLVTRHYMKEKRMDRPEAEAAARLKLSEMPAWKDRK